MQQSLFDEAVLVDRAISGDADAFGELYRLHLNAVYRYILQRVQNPSDAEDLTEQVFLKAWEALSGYEQRGNRFISWLYRIAQNAIIDHHRRHKPTIPMSVLDTYDWDSKQPTSLEEIIAAEEKTTLATAVAQLPDEQRQVINLRFSEGLNHAQVGRIIDKSPGASRMIQHRALLTLNQMLASTMLRAVGIVFAGWLVAGVATVYAASGALPGDVLYPLKRAVESVQITLSLSDLDDARLRLAFAETRLDEAARLLAENRPEGLEPALSGYAQQFASVVALVGQENRLSPEAQAALAELLLAAQANHEAQLKELSARAPAAAREAIRATLQDSRDGRDEVLKMIEDRSGGALPLPAPPTATPTPTSTPTPTATPAPPTATPTPTSTPTWTPTATPAPPTATRTPTWTPTATPAPPTSTPTPKPSPTPLPALPTWQIPAGWPPDCPVPPNLPAEWPPECPPPWEWPSDWPLPPDWPAEWPTPPEGWPDLPDDLPDLPDLPDPSDLPDPPSFR